MTLIHESATPTSPQRTAVRVMPVHLEVHMRSLHHNVSTLSRHVSGVHTSQQFTQEFPKEKCSVQSRSSPIKQRERSRSKGRSEVHFSINPIQSVLFSTFWDRWRLPPLCNFKTACATATKFAQDSARANSNHYRYCDVTVQYLLFEWPLIRPGFPVDAVSFVYTVVLTFES